MRVIQPGPETFLQLGDTPNSYLGAAGEVATVTITENGLEFAPGGGPGGTAWGTITGTLSAQTDLQTALNDKQDTLVSGTNIKTINGESILGSGNLVISGGSGLTSLQVFSAVSIRM